MTDLLREKITTNRFTLLIFSFIAFLFLFFGFYNNTYNVVAEKRFENFEKYSESLVIGKLAVAKKQGIFYKGGLTGRIMDVPKNKNPILYQYELYTKQLEFNSKKYHTYNSQTGGQALFFASLDNILPFKKSINLKIFYIITSILSSILLTLFLVWVAGMYDVLTAAFALLFILLSPWITIFGRNIWWSLWSFYIPFITMLLCFNKESLRNIHISYFRLFLISLMAMLAKCFFTGFEYITTTIIMALTPLLFYTIYQHWNLKKFIKRLFYVSSGYISAILLSFVILAIQISYVKGSIVKGFEHIIYSFGKRTSGDPSNFPEVYKDSLQSSYTGILKKYLTGKAYDFNSFIHFGGRHLWIIDFRELIFIFIVFSILYYYILKRVSINDLNRSKGKALLITLWVSILAPISWFIIFKGHSYIHTHMNFIVWYMPFCLFGFVVIGVVLSHLLKRAFNFFKRNN